MKPPAVPAARAPIKGKAPSPARSGSSKAAKEASSAEASSKQQGAKQQRAIAMATAKPAEAKPEDIVLTEATLDMTGRRAGQCTAADTPVCSVVCAMHNTLRLALQHDGTCNRCSIQLML